MNYQLLEDDNFGRNFIEEAHNFHKRLSKIRQNLASDIAKNLSFPDNIREEDEI